MMKLLFITMMCLLFLRHIDPSVRITCLDHRDTVSQKENIIKTRFLIESLSDTLNDLDIRCACGCEYAEWNRSGKIYPGHPDTIYIFSMVKNAVGHWNKSTYIHKGGWSEQISTGPWLIVP